MFLAACMVLCPGCTQPPPEPAAKVTVPGLEFQPPDPGTYQLPAIQDAADGVVVDVDGSSRRLFDYLGDRHVLLSFVYTRCSDPTGCPLARATLQSVQAAMASRPELAEEVRLITLSFDPQRDTPDAMRTYASQDQQGTGLEARPWVFLTTRSWDDLQPILDGYGQSVVPETDENGDFTGDFSHVLKLYLIDRRRRVRNIYNSNYAHPAIALNDLETLLLEEAGSS